MKTSELMLKAKNILRTVEQAAMDTGQGDPYICHSLMKADGSYYCSGGSDAPIAPSPECKRALETVGMFVRNESTGFGNHYENFVRNLFGDIAAESISPEATQAGRHRLLDFLIVEFQIQGD